ncbi:hypothetical protein HYU11_02225 [Candidatus Woesearchaeota archaeon]|nr:hypothetical protein [Candidatus Woesearchaeota archaeon]
MKKALPYLMLLALAFPGSFAESISVSPDNLFFYVSGKSDSKQLIVYNGNSESRVFRMDADELNEWFHFDKNEFSVMPGSFEKVIITVSPDVESGVYYSDIRVYPEGKGKDELSISLHAVVKAKVVVDRKPDARTGFIVSSSIVAAGLLMYNLLRLGQPVKL